MAIIVDAKTPPQDASENSDTHHMDVPPPEYVAEELPHRTNNDLPVPVTTPADKPTTSPTNHDRWWRRWMRSPIALALIFLACAVIATGIGLAVHFTVGRSRPPEYPPWPDGGPGPGPGPGGNMTGADAYGPWTSSVKTFSFPRDIAHMEFLSLQGLVDGYTQINVGRPDQTNIEADVNIQWKARVLTSTPTVNSYYDPTNSSISITCPPSYDTDPATLPDIFIVANITVRLPPNYAYGSLKLQSTAQSPHCWNSTIANLTAANISFDTVTLQSEQGALIVRNMTVRHFQAISDYGDICGTVDASDSYAVSSQHGVVSIVNRHNSTTSTASTRSQPPPPAPAPPGPGGPPRLVRC